MFTGIIETVGTILQIVPAQKDIKVLVNAGSINLKDVALGDSIATNGVCLTVIEKNDNSYWADVSAETLALTRFGQYKVGQRVNLEQAVTPSTRLGGHMVSGHVDGIATCTDKQNLGNAIEFWFSPNDQALLKYIPYKGSVSIDGISLTVNAVTKEAFKLTIVPHTLASTSLKDMGVGDSVNLEVDMMARYLEHLLAGHQSSPHTQGGLTMDALAKAGFIG